MMATGADKELSIASPYPYEREDKMKVELDKKALFALASDSRMEILKALHPQRRTIAQLADQLGIDKAAVHRHLRKLEEGDLVTRFEDHGFVYYGLSWKARDVVSPGENTKIIIIFGTGLLMVGAAIAAILSYASKSVWRVGESQAGSQPSGSAEDLYSGVTSNPEMIALGIILLVISAILIYLAWRRVRTPKQKANPTDGSLSPSREDIAD